MNVTTFPSSMDDRAQLAIETSGRTGSLAILKGHQVLRETTIGAETRTAAGLAVALQDILAWCRSRQISLGFISVTAGPGSFTGLRIGVTTAKTLAYALALPLVATDSLAAIAATVLHDHEDVEQVLVGVNAYRGQVFAAQYGRVRLDEKSGSVAAGMADSPWRLATLFRSEQGRAPAERAGRPPRAGETAGGAQVLEQQAWLDWLQSSGSAVAVAGDASVCSLPLLTARLFSRRSPDAVGCGWIGREAAQQGQWVDPISLVPRYLRPSAAEEQATPPRP